MALPTASLVRALGVRPNEHGRVLAVAASFGVLEAGRVLGDVGVETLIQGRFGPTGLPTVLPWLYMGLGALGLGVALIYGAALGRFGRRPVFLMLLGLAAVGMVAGWAAVSGGSDDAIVGLWLGVSVVGGLLLTISWTLAGSAFDARQARRLFPLLTAAAIAGGFTASLAAGPLTALFGAADLVLLEAVALVLAMPLVALLARHSRARPTGRARGSVLAGMRTGMDTVRASPLLRRIAACYVLLAVLMFSIQYPFTVSVATALPTDAERATALGVLSAAVTATSFLVSALVAGRVYARFGISTGAVMLPVVYLAGFALWLVWFAFPTALAVRFAQQVTQRGFSNASWSAFYNVVPAERRAQVIAFTDGVPGQLGTILSGVLLLVAARALSLDVVFVLGLVAAMVTTALVVGIRRGYGHSLVAALRTGVGERLLEGGPGIEPLLRDPSVAPALTGALQAPEPGVREMAARLLGEDGVADDVARQALVESTRDADPRVRVAAIDALARLGAFGPATPAHGTPGALDPGALSQDPDPRVRAAAVVASAGGDPAAVIALVSDPVPVVRATALLALMPPEGGSLTPEARTAAVRALGDRAGPVRTAAATVLGTDRAQPTDLLAQLDGRQPASMAALDALSRSAERFGQDPGIHAVVLAFAGGQVERVTRLRDDRSGLGQPARPIDAFLVSTLALRERAGLDSLLGALAVLGAPEATGLVRRSLGSDDPDVRAQAIEALEALGDRRLARRVTQLLDDTPPVGPRGIERLAVLDALAHDDDPWLRRLAQACREGPGMPDATRTMTELETMLALRRVSLFDGLDPEDLQRIAASAVERRYEPGEVLMTEGEPSDELVVLLAGSVRVERVGPDGAPRFLRTYEAGEHIGELAVLRERPRAATVTAEAEGARGLVVPGLGLRDVLRERPGAAMAMLATLAERVSRQ